MNPSGKRKVCAIRSKTNQACRRPDVPAESVCIKCGRWSARRGAAEGVGPGGDGLGLQRLRLKIRGHLGSHHTDQIFLGPEGQHPAPVQDAQRRSRRLGRGGRRLRRQPDADRKEQDEDQRQDLAGPCQRGRIIAGAFRCGQAQIVHGDAAEQLPGALQTHPFHHPEQALPVNIPGMSMQVQRPVVEVGQGVLAEAHLQLAELFGVAFEALAFLLRDAPHPGSGEAAKASVREALGAVLRKPSALMLMAGLGFYFYAKYGFNTWIINYLQREFPSMTAASASFHGVFWFYLGAVVGVFAGGRVSDRLAASRPQVRFDVNAAGLALCVPGLLLSAFAPTAALCVVGTALFGFATGVYDSNIYASLFEVVKPRYRAAAVGVFGCGGSVIGASGPAVLGWMNAHFSMSSGIASLSAFALAGAAVIGVARVFFFERDRV